MASFRLRFSLACALLLPWSCGAAPAAPAAGEFQQKLRPVLQEHCFKCHNADKHKGGIDLTQFDSEGAVLKKYKLWQRVIEQVATEQMPPDDDKFTPMHGEVVVGGVRKILALLDSGHPALLDPGPSVVRRLSRTEYANVIRDLTGLTLDLARIGFPEDSTGSSFDNVAQALNVSPALLEKYFAAADLVVEDLCDQAKPLDDKLKKVRTQFFASLPEPADRPAVAQFVARFLRLAWRRPLAPGEAEPYLKLYDGALAAGAPPRAALGKTLKPALVSPDFLYRIEEDRTPKTPVGGTVIPAARVSDVELASRLSFFLWASIPDEELLALAEKNQLSAPIALETQVRRMLGDPRAKALTDNFFLRWLGAYKVLQARPSTEFFPTFNDQLKRSMLAEVSAFCDHLRSDDRPVLELLQADYTFANADLAKHYGLDEIKAKDVQQVALKPESHRGGLLGMGAVLASTSHTNRTSPTQRGKWVLDVIFGNPPPPPPANAGQFKDEKKTREPKDFREKLAQHASDETCAACHRKMDPLGFGLDNFDATGAWRPTSADLDTSGKLPTGEKFDGVDGLKEILWDHRDQFVRNLAAQMLTYALGRELDYFDEGQVTRIKAAADQKGDRLSAVVLALVNSYPFQYRRNADPQPEAAKTVQN